MRRLDDGDVWLDKGDIAPVLCDCGSLYVPEEHSEWSKCPDCGRENIHELMPAWTVTKEKQR